MPLKDPKHLQEEFWRVLKQLQTADAPLEINQQHQLSDQLVDVYNYVSAQANKRGNSLNTLHALSAHDAKLQKLNKEQNNLNNHRKFVEDTVEKADQYLKTIQLAGYAAFFAAWGFTCHSLPSSAEAVAAILMIFSATLFIAWEIFKASILVILLRSHAQLGTSRIEEFVQNDRQG